MLFPFNSRPHAEVDYFTHDVYRYCILSTHDLTQRSTSRPPTFRYLPVSFNSRPHAEVDRLTASIPFNTLSFNSRPHAEVDRAWNRWNAEIYLSTHDLTQRSTVPTVVLYVPISFNSRPHAEVDFQFPGLLHSSRCSFNSRPHAEVDDGSAFGFSIRGIFQLTTSRRGRRRAVSP